MHRWNIDVVIPALNEERSVGDVVARIPRPPVRRVIVVDNGSTDGTAVAAREAGATVVQEPNRGYGAACLKGLSALQEDSDIVVFLDADGSDHPEHLGRLLEPLLDDRADLVVGARAGPGVERGAMTVPQRFGNWMASGWLRTRYSLPASDLGPFRAIRRAKLSELRMTDRDYGWTVEMQIKAARAGLRYAEVEVPYRRRVGQSKISGTVRGTFGAGIKILTLLARYDLGRHPFRRGS